MTVSEIDTNQIGSNLKVVKGGEAVASTNVLLSIDSKVAVLTLNRPERRNALSLELMREVTDCLNELEGNRSVQVVILAASGTVFSSGHDLCEMTGKSEAEYQRIFGACNEMMQKIQAIPQPVIAEVQGVATAAGCQLVATCDLAIASEHATFATPGVRIGLFCTTPMVAVSRAIGRKRAMQMLLTGEPIKAATAAEWGLINDVVPPESLKAATRQLAGRITEASSLIVSIGKRAFYKQIELEQSDAYEMAKEVMTSNALTEDAQEGIAAFLGKRAPCWRDR
jgi:enoyl-CoA hydratase/carnithine racemase